MNIKDYREKELKSFIIGNVLLLIIFSNDFKTLLYSVDINIKLSWIGIVSGIITEGMISSVIYVFSFILDSSVSEKIKRIITNLWFPMPGEIIFYEIREKCKDIRFTSEQAKIKYKEIYKILDDYNNEKNRRHISNSNWNRIFKKYQEQTKILISHRDYLMCRDMCVFTAYVGCLYLIFVLLGIMCFSYKLLLFILFEWFILMLASKNKARKFVYNVIDEDINNEE